MGFFPHEKTSNSRRYVGIWYTMDPKTVVWIANHENPGLDSSGVVLTVPKDGNLPGEVKRLSNHSRQGLQEFKNEVMAIAKLQHRNLVRLLGYCIRENEKILLYEFWPNRSLDSIICDRKRCTSLDWKMGFNIIMGIARGLSYLHHDSRLRIIHKDLKTSNILVDEDMNKKYSDFGLAEIASGKRNNGFYQSQRSTSLVGQAWSLWMEHKPDLMDEILMESCNPDDVSKCIIMGLVFIQGQPDDHPTMTNMVLMLGVNSLSSQLQKNHLSFQDKTMRLLYLASLNWICKAETWLQSLELEGTNNILMLTEFDLPNDL